MSIALFFRCSVVVALSRRKYLPEIGLRFGTISEKLRNMTPEQLATERDRAGKCILCDEPKPSRRRGLCEMHHGRFMTALRAIPREKREEFEQSLIEKGMLLPARRGQKLRPDEDEFRIALAEFEAAELRERASAALPAGASEVEINAKMAELRRAELGDAPPAKPKEKPRIAQEIAAELVESAKKATDASKKNPVPKPKAKRG